MLDYAASRMLRMGITVFAIVTAVFFATRVSGNAVDFIAGEGLGAEDRQRMIDYFGLSQPIWVQYGRFLYAFVDGNFGISLVERRPVVTIMAERIMPSLQLIGSALLVTFLVGIPAGVLAAVYRKSWIGSGIMTVAFLGYAVPNFILAIFLLLIFSFWLGWLPSTGNATLANYVMPVLALSAFYIAGLTRFTRNAMLDVLSQDYLRTARSKGLRERKVIFKHALRNALITILSVVGLQVAALVAAGNVVVETVFAWRGMGELLVSAALSRDYPVLQFGVLCVAVVVIVVNLVVDIAYGLADPRVRLAKV
ncbi:peptide ABC transporter permease [Mesorhizobium sp. L-8-10]|uniref:ABC transporter permease n=1 Tax=Mesorhizobium sp. L-8-10 TaxID=2744523 RepID=UPI0019371692|nr:ABC transporter permease [Mesorhizobium sp. L-8-10]BCH35506.1 peptide ABC transporter permease [Mesorhizobium sp. L-8-10]